MKMVVTMRNGIQIDFEVDSFTTKSRRGSGELVGIEWEGGSAEGNTLSWVSFPDVAAVHAVRSKGDENPTNAYV